MKYTIVTGYHAQDLVSKVGPYLKLGWVPLGGLVVVQHPCADDEGVNFEYLQTLTKEEDTHL